MGTVQTVPDDLTTSTLTTVFTRSRVRGHCSLSPPTYVLLEPGLSTTEIPPIFRRERQKSSVR